MLQQNGNTHIYVSGGLAVIKWIQHSNQCTAMNVATSIAVQCRIQCKNTYTEGAYANIIIFKCLQN